MHGRTNLKLIQMFAFAGLNCNARNRKM